MLTSLAVVAWTDVCGWLLCTVAGLVLFWAMLWDRSKGRWRCAGCWYDLESCRPADGGFPLNGITCPECGRVSKSARSLLRTKRRWSAVLLVSLLLLGAVEVIRLPFIRARGPLAAIPTGLLMFIAEPKSLSDSLGPSATVPFPIAPLPGSPARLLSPATTLDGEMWTRIKGGEGWYWQRALFVHRVIRSEGANVTVIMGAPERWPRGRPVPIRIDHYRFMSSIGGQAVRPTGQTSVAGTDFVAVAPECARAGELVVDYDVLGPMGKLCQLRSRSPLALADETSPLLLPVADTATNELVRTTLAFKVIADDEGRVRLLMNPAFDPQIWQKLGFGVAGRVILRDGDTELARSELVASAFSTTHDQQRTLPLEWAEGGRERAAARIDAITIEMRGDPAMAEELYLTQVALLVPARAWAGSIVIPARVP